AAAHMSLHLNRQCQRADAHPPPVRLFRASVNRPRRGAKRTRDLVKRPRPLAGGAYMCRSWNRQPTFCNFVAVRRRAVFGAPLLPLVFLRDNARRQLFKRATALI